MSLKLNCSLCLAPSNHYKPLQDDEGNSKDFYETTIKYFDPMLLKSREEANKCQQMNQVICQNCWKPIKYFYKFQQNILRSRLLSEKVIIEVEDDDQVDAITNNKKDGDNYTSGDDGGNYAFSNENVYVKPDSNLGSDCEEREFISDEEATMCSLLEKTLVKLECDDQVDEIFDHKDVNDDHKNSDDDGKYKYSYKNNVYVKPDLDLEADYQEQQFKSDEDEDNDDDEYDDDKYKDDDEDDKPLIFFKNNTNKKSKILKAKPEIIITTKESRKPKEIKSGVRVKAKTINTDQDQVQKKTCQLNDEHIKEKSLLTLEKPWKADLFITQWKSELDCDLCEETSSSFDGLRNHFKEKHKTRFYIKCCERKFYRRWNLVHHIQIHLNPVSHKYKRRKLMNGKIEKFECEFCHKLFNFKTLLNRHLLTHATKEKDFACKECDKTFARKANLKLHILRIHRVCNQWGKTIGSTNALKKHSTKHTCMENIAFACNVCGVKLDSPISLNNHMTTSHNDGLTIYMCSICGRVKPNAKAVLEHKKWVHAKERKCSYCDKTCKNSKDLSEHIATHTGQHLYQCAHCPKTFKTRSRMSLHGKKVHPVEWKENRLLPKVDIKHAKYQVVV